MKTIKECKTVIEAQELRIADLEQQLINALTTMNDLTQRVSALEEAPKPKARNYGPSSTAKLDDFTAWRIKFGDRKDEAVKDNADFFGLSRGQVYSLEKYTFQHVKEDSFSQSDIDDHIQKVIDEANQHIEELAES